MTIDYDYDANNRLSAMNVPGVGSLKWESYFWNSPTRTTLPGGGRRDFAYDSLMRLKSIVARDPTPATVMSRNYEYSPAGNILSKATEHGMYIYGYDNLYRLTSATNPASANEAYVYDPLGNRTNSAAVLGPWTYNLNNELLGYTNVTFACDTNGNTIRKTEETQTVNYFYDVSDRLVRVEDGGGSVIAEYGYDPFGRRLWKEVAGVRTWFFYSEEGLIGEYDAAGVEIKTYGYRPGSLWSTAPLFQRTGGTYYWYQNDHLGTPQKLMDSSGHVVWAGTYDSFGNCQVTVAEVESNLRFPGQHYDAETGLYYNWARYYDPRHGRYLSRDPLGQGENHFSYCFNNPLGLIDPAGRCALIQSQPAYQLLQTLLGIGRDWGTYYHNLTAARYNPLTASLVATASEVLRVLGVMTYLEGGWLGFDTLTGRDLSFEERVQRTLLGAVQSGLSIAGLAEGLHAGLGAKPTTEIGYHATRPEFADSVLENGFRESQAGRLGGGGVYVNNSSEGAIAEYLGAQSRRPSAYRIAGRIYTRLKLPNYSTAK